MDRYGWVCLHRKLMESWIWKGDGDLLKFWIWCLLRACHSPCKATVGKVVVELQRGQLVLGRSMAAEKTGLSERKIRTCLSVLQKDKNDPEIILETTNKYSVLTIVKYDEYQIQPKSNDRQTSSKRPADRPTNDHIQEVKEVNTPPTPQKGEALGGVGLDLSDCDPDSPAGRLFLKLNERWEAVLETFPELRDRGVSPHTLSQILVLTPVREPLLAVSHMIEAIKDQKAVSAPAAARFRVLNGLPLQNGTLGKLRRALGEDSASHGQATGFVRRKKKCVQCEMEFSYGVNLAEENPQEFEQCPVCRRNAAGFSLESVFHG